MRTSKWLSLFSMLLLAFSLVACGGSDGGGGGGIGANNDGGGGGGNIDANNDGGGSGDGGDKQGQFIDSAVGGLTFSTATRTDTTDAEGHFTYVEGETVEFFVGGIKIGESLAKSIITPIDLVPGAVDETHPTVTNIVRFLMTLDDDGDADEGLTITQEVQEALLGLTIDFSQSVEDFEADADVTAIVAKLADITDAGTTALVSIELAQEHLSDTLVEVDTQALLIGTWKVVETNDGEAGEIYTIDTTTITAGLTECNETWAYTTSGDTITTTLTALSPTAEGCDSEINEKDTATFTVTETTLTFTGEFEGSPYTDVFERAGGGSAPPSATSLIGTWSLASLNGVNVSSDETLNINATTITVSGLTECNETLTYTLTSNHTMDTELTAVSPIPAGGCDHEIGHTDTVIFTLTETTFTFGVVVSRMYERVGS